MNTANYNANKVNTYIMIRFNNMCAKGFFVVLLFTFLTLPGCTDDYGEASKEADRQKTAPEVANDGMIPNLIRVKLTEDLGNKVGTRAITAVNGMLKSNDDALTQCLSKMGTVEMNPVFPIEPKYEERMRREGLHLWYDIVLNPQNSIRTTTRAMNDVAGIPGVEIVELIPQYTLIGTTADATFSLSGGFDFEPIRPINIVMPFNDPQLPKQWHYFNNGAGLKSAKGADLNLFEAWQRETGKPNVIVAVIDGGVFYEHEDLKGNIWTNPSPGIAGGTTPYINDIHGYNFADNCAEIAYDAHGTHVAGVVGAVNNNGIGVCGVAGGNGTSGTGVKIMVCDAFGKSKGQAFEKAFVYAANHGAVISQNSWGGAKFLSPSLKSAIDYFIKYAGCDNEGKQLPDSPMKGGVVLFAAGNESSDDIVYPAAYGPVVTISAMAPDWKKAYYTNRGDWIDLMAPGGDIHYPGGQIYSTSVQVEKDSDTGEIVKAVSHYEYMQGTSMACPHASGVAALIVSHLGGKGFTNEMCKKNLLTALRPSNIDEYNVGYEGILGFGYLDAARALDVDMKKAPAQINKVNCETGYTHLTLSFPAVSDEDDRTATYYTIYYSDRETLNEQNFRGMRSFRHFGLNYKVGENIALELKDLALNHTYSYAIVPKDRWGNEAAPTFVSAKTLENKVPVIEQIQKEKVRITGTETALIELKITDPEGHKWSYTTRGDRTGVSIEQNDNLLRIQLSARGAVGLHSFTIIVTDEYGAVAKQEIAFEVYTNSIPVLSKPLGSLYLPLGKDMEIDLSQYITDPDGHKVMFQISNSSNQIVTVREHSGKLILTPNSIGKSSIQVRAIDEQGAELYVTLRVKVVKDEIVYHVYPIPTYDDLNILLANQIRKAIISVANGEGAIVYRKEVSRTDTQSNSEYKLDIKSLSGGTYLLIVESGSERYTRSFIKY